MSLACGLGFINNKTISKSWKSTGYFNSLHLQTMKELQGRDFYLIALSFGSSLKDTISSLNIWNLVYTCQMAVIEQQLFPLFL